MKVSSQKVQNELDRLNLNIRVLEFKQSTKTCELAAQALHVEVARIVKSLVFLAGNQPVLVLVSGQIDRVDDKQLGSLLGVSKLRLARAEEVRELTGFAIGGVSPFGLKQKLPVYLDESLLRFDCVYCAAGTPNSMFGISPQELIRCTEAKVIALLE